MHRKIKRKEKKTEGGKQKGGIGSFPVSILLSPTEYPKDLRKFQSFILCLKIIKTGRRKTEGGVGFSKKLSINEAPKEGKF